MSVRSIALVALLALAAPRLLVAQERGATALGEAVAGLDVTARVLVIGAHPDDEDTQLITWLARGRQVETAYLSLTRGDGGQNLIGNELGPLLGMIRTEELLAARRLDGGRQFFTRAYDFGFSKSADETFAHWPKDSLLRDVVTVVRSFRPQIIVAVFSGTPRDGHGHHQVSAILAREAYDAAADTMRFPRARTLGLGAWTPAKFYRASRFNPAEATVAFNVGELSALRGRTYAEMASESRSQHLSQGFGSLERRGTSMDYLKLEESRVGSTSVKERAPTDGLPAAWSRFGGAALRATGRAALDSLPAAVAEVRRVERLTAPDAMVAPLARVVGLATAARDAAQCGGTRCGALGIGADAVTGDLVATMETTLHRATTALLAAAGVLVEATAPREIVAVGDAVPVTVTLYNQGRADVALESARAWMTGAAMPAPTPGPGSIAADSAGRVTMSVTAPTVSDPWWLAAGEPGGTFVPPAAGSAAAANIAIGEERIADSQVSAVVRVGDTRVPVSVGPIVYRFADPARGERRRPVVAVPAINVTLDDDVEYARAGVPFDRIYRVHLQSAASTVRGVSVTLTAPAGLTVDTSVRRVALEPNGAATLRFRLRGTLRAGRHAVTATATSDGQTFAAGYLPISYEHIRPLRYYRPASVRVEAVNATLPPSTTVAYIQGVGDNVAPMLAQLGLAVTVLAPEQLASAELSRFGAMVIGPRAFAASPALVAQAPRLQAYARAGGTVVVQYGQTEMQAPGLLPYPVTLARPAERVTEEVAPVRVLDPAARLLASPNRITAADFAGWVQERSTYMPTTADPHWRRLLEMHDPGAPANENAVLVAPVGKGAYVYVTLALFRQLPAGVPGAARIFLNLLSADGATTTSQLQP